MTGFTRFSRSISAFLLLFVCGARAAVFTVTTTNGDASAGSFGAALAGAASNAAVSDTVAFSAPFNAPQTITLTQSMTAVAKNAGVSLNMSPVGALTVNGGAFSILNVSGGGTFTAHNITFNGSSASGLSVGAGTTLSLDRGFGAGLSLTNGTLIAAASMVASGAVALTGTGTVNVAAGQSATFGGVVSGTGGLVKTGNGTLLLAGNNTYAGGTTINSGTLAAASAAALGGASSGITFNGGTLSLLATMTVARGVVMAGAGTVDTGGNTVTLSGTISGGGPLTKTGNGTLVLTGNNTHSGGTAISAGTLSISSDANLGSGALSMAGATTLQTTGGITSNRVITLGGPVTIQTMGNSSTYNGPIGGAGGLTFMGGGVQTLNGFNSYTGGTTVNGGVLAISGDAALGALGGALTLNGGATLRISSNFVSNRTVQWNGGATFDVMGGDAAFFGQLNGSGTLIKSGNGTLTLGGNNSYAGGTTVNGGTLAVFSDAALGSGGGLLTLNGTTLRTLGTFVSARNVLLNGPAVIHTNGNDAVLSGVVSGAGSLNKAGAGTLTLNGDNTYTGGTVVSGGTLRLGDDDVLSGGSLSTSAGAVFDLDGHLQTLAAVTNAGTIDAGAGRLTASSYGGGGTLSVLLRRRSLNLDVSGAADFSGGTLIVGGRPASGRYRVASAGTLTGALSDIQFPAGKTGEAVYTGTQLLLDVWTVSALGRPELDPGLAPLAALLDEAALHSTGDLDEVLMDLNGFSPGRQAEALRQISPLGFGALGGLGLAASRMQSEALERRVEGLRTGGPDGDRFAAFSGARTRPVVLVADAVSDVPPAYFSDGGGAGVFVSAAASSAERDPAGLRSGYDLSSGGATAGVDYALSEGLAAGLSLGAFNGSAEIAGGGGSIDGRSLRYGAYGAAARGRFTGSLYLGGASDSFDSRRTIAFLGRTATASPRGREINARLRADVRLPAGRAALAVHGGLSHDSLAVDAFSESGAGALNLAVEGHKAESLQSTLGVKAARAFRKGAFIPFAGLSWLHEFKDPSPALDAGLSSVGTFRTEAAEASRDGALVGLGASAAWGRVSASVGYTGEFRSDYRSHGFNGGVRLSF